VRRQTGEEAVVELVPKQQAWVCSECGSFSTDRAKNSGVVTCEHVGAATRDMPHQTALAMCSALVPPQQPKVASPAPAGLDHVAVMLAKSAEERAERNRKRDEEYRALTSEVTVRTMTEEDRERLRLARERKQKARGLSY
jgi:hypothetical protein